MNTSLPVLKERLIKEKMHRPLIKQLDDQGIEDFIKNSIQKRKEYYNQSHIILPTESISDITFDEIKRKYV